MFVITPIKIVPRESMLSHQVRIESDTRQVQRLVGEWRSIAPLYYGDFIR